MFCLDAGSMRPLYVDRASGRRCGFPPKKPHPRGTSVLSGVLLKAPFAEAVSCSGRPGYYVKAENGYKNYKGSGAPASPKLETIRASEGGWGAME